MVLTSIRNNIGLICSGAAAVAACGGSFALGTLARNAAISVGNACRPELLTSAIANQTCSAFINAQNGYTAGAISLFYISVPATTILFGSLLARKIIVLPSGVSDTTPLIPKDKEEER